MDIVGLWLLTMVDDEQWLCRWCCEWKWPEGVCRAIYGPVEHPFQAYVEAGTECRKTAWQFLLVALPGTSRDARTADEHLPGAHHPL